MGKIRILVVSEGRSCGKSILGMLDSSLFSADVVSFSELDPKAMCSNRPDLVILDSREMISSTCDALKLIRICMEVTVVVLLDATDAESNYAVLSDMGADGFLVKPLRRTLLESYVKAKLRRVVPVPEGHHREFASSFGA